MNQAYPASVDDPAADCPVPPETVGRLTKAGPESPLILLDGIPEATRARLASGSMAAATPTRSACGLPRPARVRPCAGPPVSLATFSTIYPVAPTRCQAMACMVALDGDRSASAARAASQSTRSLDVPLFPPR